MTKRNARAPICCCRSGRQPGRTCWSAPCSPSNCSGRPRSLPTTLIIGRAEAMRPIALALTTLPLLAASSAPAPPQGPAIDVSLSQARAEQAAAEAEAAKLERAADRARGQAERLRAQQLAAAQAIEAAEARITTSDAELRVASAFVAAHRQRLAVEQRPVASLLAGLAVMAERPPLLAIADSGGTDELVKVRILLDSTLPFIRIRTARLTSQLSQGQRLEQAASAAHTELARSRQDLVAKRQRFAAL